MEISKYLEKNIEVFKNNVKEVSINVLNDSLKDFGINDLSKYILKSKINGKYVSLITEDILDYEKNIKTLEEMANILDNDDDSSFATEQVCSDRLSFEKVDYQEIIFFLTKLNNLRDKYSKIAFINSNFYHLTSSYNIKNNKVDSFDSNNTFIFFFEVTLKDNDINEVSYFSVTDISFNLDEIYSKVEKEITDLYDRLDVILLPSKNYNLVLTPSVVASILTTFKNMFDAKNIKSKLSVCSNKFDEKIFSEKITIIEDPTNRSYPGTRLFDTEGTKTFCKTIVDNGKFVLKLHNNQSAKLENTSSTGNNYGVRNLYIKPSDININFLNSYKNDYVLVTSVAGLHSGINTKTGTISIQSKGFYIKNNTKKAIDSFIINTTLFELFSNVDEVFNDLEFSSSFIGSPTIAVKDIYISTNEKTKD